MDLLVFSVATAFASLHAVAGTSDVNESMVLSKGSDACVHDPGGAKLFKGVNVGVKFGTLVQVSDNLEVAALLLGVKSVCMY